MEITAKDPFKKVVGSMNVTSAVRAGSQVIVVKKDQSETTTVSDLKMENFLFISFQISFKDWSEILNQPLMIKKNGL